MLSPPTAYLWKTANEMYTVGIKADLKNVNVNIRQATDCVHCVSKNDTKNDTDVTHYRFNPHQPISVIFGRDVAERVCY